MFVINEDKSIYITRGDVAFFSVKSITETGEAYKFQAGEVVRFKVFEKKACENVVLSKDFGIEAETEEVTIYLEEKDTKIGDVISKPVDYWYEVELNPYTDPQTILGYDEDGAKVFRLYPEGNEAEDSDPITPEDIPVVDEELSLTSTRPVQNQAIARAIVSVREDCTNFVNSEIKYLRDYSKEMFVTNVQTVGSELEWVHPPMESGVEYRLAERFMGKPVYVKTFLETFDETLLPKFELLLGDVKMESIIDYGGCFFNPTTGAILAFPFSAKGNNIYSSTYISHNTIAVIASKHVEDSPVVKEIYYSGVKMWIKYTKTTD